MTMATLDSIGPGRLGGLTVAGVGASAPATVECLAAAAARPASAAASSVCVSPGHLDLLTLDPWVKEVVAPLERGITL